MKFNFEKLQNLGRALMLPIALLPVAGILLRIGQPDLMNLKYIADAGNVVFHNLPLLFALGIAVGLAKDNNGTAALASCVGYLVMTSVITDINKDLDTGVLGGILIGIVTASLYNRYKDIRLPEYLSFFGGKRFVPIATGVVAVILGTILGYIWLPIQNGINILANWTFASGGIGLFIYGIVNRLLLLTGLHHVINNLVWFVFGSYPNSSGAIVHGDIARFMAGDPTAGRFMSGYFPIMMFGLPAACLAMYKNSFSENKKAVAGLLASMALTSFLTGVTEPVEFSFVFLAPALFMIHAVLTGISLAVMYLLHVHMGFTFSAGLIDYILFYKLDTHPLYLIPVGFIFFAIYFIIFDFAIRKYNLKTIGRDVTNQMLNMVRADSRPLQFIDALGGSRNLVVVDACTTRLRLTVLDSGNINKDMLSALGARGVIAPTKETLQVIIGPTADIVAGEIRQAMAANHATHLTELKNHTTELHDLKIATDIVLDDKTQKLAATIVNYLGGIDNIKSFSIVAITRLRVEVNNSNKIDMAGFAELGDIELIDISGNIKQIYIGNNAQNIFWAFEKF
jgi:PTS system N-acetylglucosamine-specific IIC component